MPTSLLSVGRADKTLLSMLTRITAAEAEVALRDHEAILQMTAEVFPDAVISVEETADPEIENYEHIAVEVVMKGDVGQLVEGHRVWHRRLRSVATATARYYVLSLSAA